MAKVNLGKVVPTGEYVNFVANKTSPIFDDTTLSNSSYYFDNLLIIRFTISSKGVFGKGESSYNVGVLDSNFMVGKKFDESPVMCWVNGSKVVGVTFYTGSVYLRNDGESIPANTQYDITVVLVNKGV